MAVTKSGKHGKNATLRPRLHTLPRSEKQQDLHRTFCIAKASVRSAAMMQEQLYNIREKFGHTLRRAEWAEEMYRDMKKKYETQKENTKYGFDTNASPCSHTPYDSHTHDSVHNQIDVHLVGMLKIRSRT